MKKVFIFIKKIFTKKLTDEQIEYCDLFTIHLFRFNITLISPIIFFYFKPVHWHINIDIIAIVVTPLLIFRLVYLIYLRERIDLTDLGEYLWGKIVFFVFFAICFPTVIWALIFSVLHKV